MKLNRLTVYGFGRLTSLPPIAFAPGLNLLYGENESGKSTLQQAILAALYGFHSYSKGSRGPLPEYEPGLEARYKPWSGGGYACCIEYDLDDGRRYAFDRGFDGSSSRLSVRDLIPATDISGGLDLGRCKSLSPDAVLTYIGSSRDAFVSSAFIGQGQLTQLAAADTLSTAFAAAVDTGARGVPADKSAAALGKEADGLGKEAATSDRSDRPLSDALRRQKQAEQRLNGWLGAEQAAEARVSARESLRQQLAATEPQLRHLRYAAARLDQERLDGIAQAADRARAERDARLADRDRYAEWAAFPVERDGEAKELWGAIEAGRRQRERWQQAAAPEARRAAPRVSSSRPVAAAILCLLALAVFAAGIAMGYLLPGLLLAVVLGVAALALSRRREGEAEAGDAGAAGALADLERELGENEAKLRALLAQAGVIGSDLKRCLVTFNERAAARRAFDDCRRAVQDSEHSLTIALQGHTPDELAVKHRAAAQAVEQLLAQDATLAEVDVTALGDATAISREEQALLAEADRLRSDLDKLEGAIASAFDSLGYSRAEAEEQLAAVRREVARLQHYKQALELARDQLQEAMAEARGSFVPALEAEMGKSVGLITAGRYEQARVTHRGNEMLLALVDKGTGEARAAEHLSVGTREQCYICLRLAMARNLSEGGEKLPLILDDPFANCDAPRLKRMLEFVGRLAQDHQVLLFTKDPTIREWFEASFADDAGCHYHDMAALCG